MSRTAAAAALRPGSIVAAAALAVAFGAVAFLDMPLAPAPRTTGPRLVVTARAADATGAELVELVTMPLERQLLALPAVAGIDSTTADGELRLVVRGRVGADADALLLAVERRLSRLETAVDGAEVELEPADGNPLLEVAVLGGDPATRTAFARDVLAPELARAAPSEGIDLLGTAPLRVVVTPRRAALAARGLTAADLAARLRRIGVTTSLGRVREGAVARPLVVGETVASLAQLGELRLPAPGGDAVLRDVATVAPRPLGDGSVVRIDGAPAVLARVFAERHRNALIDGARLRRAAAVLARRAPKGLAVRVVTDGKTEVERALFALLGGALAAALVGVLAMAHAAPTRRGDRPSRWAMAAVPFTIAVAAFVPLALARLAGANVVLDPPRLATLGASLGVLTLPAFLAAVSRSRIDLDARPTSRAKWTSWAVALALVPSVVVAIAFFVPDRFSASARKTMTVGLVLEPQLDPQERAARGERLARDLVGALPAAPREWSWVQRAPAETAPGGDAPVGWLRLSFSTSSSFDALRTARTAARHWLAATTAARGWIETGGGRVLAGDERRPAIEVWCSAATAEERRTLATRAKARLASALPSRLIADGASPQVEWRIAPRASRIGAGGLDVDETIDAALGGPDVGALQIAGVEPGMRLLASPDDELALVPVHGAGGGAAGPVVPLGTVATLRRVSSMAPIERHDGAPGVRLIVRGGSTSDLSTVRRALATLAVGPGARLDVTGGAAEE